MLRLLLMLLQFQKPPKLCTTVSKHQLSSILTALFNKNLPIPVAHSFVGLM